MNEEYQSQRERISLAIKSHMSWTILISAAIAFALKEAVELRRTGADVLTFVMSIGITYMFTVYVSLAMRKMGKRDAKKQPMFLSTLKYLKDQKESVSEIAFLTPVFCRIKNQQALREVRRNILEENGMKLSLWEKGHYNDKEETLEKEQIKALKDIRTLKLSTLTSNQLLSEHANNKVKRDPMYLGKDEISDAISSSLRIGLSKLFLPIAFTYFSATVAFGSGVIWGIVQSLIILLIGYMYYLDGEEYVLTDLRNRYVNKAELLKEFRTLHENRSELFAEEEKAFAEIEKSS